METTLGLEEELILLFRDKSSVGFPIDALLGSSSRALDDFGFPPVRNEGRLFHDLGSYHRQEMDRASESVKGERGKRDGRTSFSTYKALAGQIDLISRHSGRNGYKRDVVKREEGDG